MAERFNKNGQEGWFHDPGYWGGFFHTYDYFQIGNYQYQPRKIHIFLPRDYEVSQEKYPVIYMNDGDTAFFPNQENKSWDMASIITKLYLKNQIRKVIVVAICPVNRDYEYTHAPVWDKEWGGLDDYSKYISHEIRGFIDDNYRTINTAENTLILGASHGGLAAFYLATKYPDKFRLVAAMSPSFWVGLDSTMDSSLFKLSGDFFGQLESSSLIYSASQTLKNPHQRLKIYLDWGLVREGGFHNQFIEERATIRGRQMRDILIQQFDYQENINLFIVEDIIGQHSEKSWSGRVENMLKIFYGF